MIPDSLKYLIPIFDTILSDDQKYREINNPLLLEENKQEQIMLDSINTIKVDKILTKYGWLTYRQTGNKGNLALTSVLLHANLMMQEKYLPFLLEALKEKKVNGIFVSTFEDRLNARKHKLQRYGTQVVYYKDKPTLYPVLNIDSIDHWRKERGFLTPLEFTLENTFKSAFDRKEYKKILPVLIESWKIKDSF